MVQQITKGIKVSVETYFEGSFYKNYKMQYAFGYQITIENKSKDKVQLISRYWNIYDALNQLEVVQGEGVIGKKPVINPGDHHTYISGCLLTSPFGAMNGFYKMINLSNGSTFNVTIPIFKLSAPFAQN